MKTIKAFIEQSHLPGALIRSTIRQAGGWQYFREIAADIAAHGADGGFPGFSYHCDTITFTRRNRAAIIAALQDLADDIGEGNIYKLIAGFSCLRSDNLTPEAVAVAIHTGKGDDVTSVYNALAWYALEEVARSYGDLIEQHNTTQQPKR